MQARSNILPQKYFHWLFLIRAYWNPKSRQDPGLGGLASRGGPANTWELSLIRLFIYIYFKITLEHKSLAAAFLRIIIVPHFYIFMWFFLPPYLSRCNVHLRTLTMIFSYDLNIYALFATKLCRQNIKSFQKVWNRLQRVKFTYRSWNIELKSPSLFLDIPSTMQMIVCIKCQLWSD